MTIKTWETIRYIIKKIVKYKDTQKKMYMMYNVQFLHMSCCFKLSRCFLKQMYFPSVTPDFDFCLQAEVWVGLLFVLHIFFRLAFTDFLHRILIFIKHTCDLYLFLHPPLTLGTAVYLLNSWVSSYFAVLNNKGLRSQSLYSSCPQWNPQTRKIHKHTHSCRR